MRAASCGRSTEGDIEERFGRSLVGNDSTAIDRIAEEIAKEALQEESLRHVLRELVHRRCEEMPAPPLAGGDWVIPLAAETALCEGG